METSAPATLHKFAVIGVRTGLSRSSIYREINAGRLKVVKLGRSVRISEAELVRFIESLGS